MEKTDKRGNQARRHHNKSRHGCLTCKKRRVKCDESKPTCRHCSRLGFSCEWPKEKEEERRLRHILPLNLAAKDLQEEPRLRRILPLNLAAKNVQESKSLLNDSEETVAILPPSHPSPYNLSQKELRLIHYYVTMHTDAKVRGGTVFSDMTPEPFVTLELSHSHEMVKHAIMHSAAAYLNILTPSSDLQKQSMKHQVAAYSHMRNAVAFFSEETADALYTSTSMMMWWAPDSRSYAAQIQGIRAVTNAMRPMLKTSRFSVLLARHFQQIDEQNTEGKHGLILPNEHDKARLELLISYLHSAESFINEMSAPRKTYFQLLLNFSLDTLYQPLGPTITEQLERLFPFGKKIMLLCSQLIVETDNRDVNNLVLFSLYSSIAVAIRPFFNAVTFIYPQAVYKQRLIGMWQYLSCAPILGDVGNKVSEERWKEALRITGLLAEFVKGDDPNGTDEMEQLKDG